MTGAIWHKGVALALVGLVAACGPITMAEAERQCFDRARLAQKPRGEAVIGVTSDRGVVGGLSLEISSDYVQGRDPAVVYETCVVSKTGEPPSRPLFARADWQV